MARERTTDGKAKTLRKAKLKTSSASKYPCPNPGKAVGLASTVRRLVREPKFAKFIRQKLRLVHRGDTAAIKCLASYYSGPTKDELDELGIPEEDRASCVDCTDHHTHFIDGAAFYGGTKKRVKKR